MYSIYCNRMFMTILNKLHGNITGTSYTDVSNENVISKFTI